LALKNIEEKKQLEENKKSKRPVLNSISCRSLRRGEMSFVLDESCSEFIDAICDYKELKGSPKKVTGKSPPSNNHLEITT